MIYLYLIVIIIMGLITFIAYADDKRKSKINTKNRTKEKTLLSLSFLFGSLGGLLSMYICRHKTKHWYFVVVNWLSFILHIFIGYLIYNRFGTTLFF